MSDEGNRAPEPEERALPKGVLDLEAYRRRRVAEGTWPIPKEEHFAFFYHWKRDRRL